MTDPTSSKITVIHCWSAPRSRSTALLYSFEARDDCCALDEPLYRQWMIDNPQIPRPYRTEMIEGAPGWEKEQLSLSDRLQTAMSRHRVIFCKHMAKHAPQFDFKQYPDTETVRHKHVLLIRDPVAVLSSWKQSSEVHGEDIPTASEIGLLDLLQIHAAVSNAAVVLNSDGLVQNPPQILKELCDSLNIPYTEQMMRWKSGPHECDGPWAPWWYHQVHQSVGWNESNHTETRYRTVPVEFQPCLQVSYAAYQYFMTLQKQPVIPFEYEDPRNAHLLVYVGTPSRGGRLIPRIQAGISPWDSSVQGGDAVWEGIRVYRGKLLHLDQHLRRLLNSAKALGFQQVHTKEQITQAIFQTLAANGMRDGAHMRLTLTRGEKYSSSMNPVFNVYGTTLIVLAEWKPTQGRTTYDNVKGVSLISASQRRNSPNTVDSKIHHNNLINNILPKIQANLADCADAIMLDVDGYVAETNATNLFLVDQDGVLVTPSPDHCLPGITRNTVLDLARELNIPIQERRVSLAEFHFAEEVFTTGTMGELTPVTCIDGRVIGSGVRGPITTRLQDVYQTLPERDGYATAIPEFY
ncbi:hypothetical protein FisN_11Hh347 [Fistulifera solaris]|jgi:branched-chain amino acid aminotransferase group I|uniref:Branched-chain amino acid aminotransferase n=1 Tax=Fistulifera solaris TaxID=1519565 RepID=A0A1Z5K9D0_FISSO|nr:hypothetical protein FisN_11Hh347 [Fistulifera solaris]|eukprot:GAX22762.1 hypothetical protein FisN_11Hh347 [Fistulifera solaris]